LLNVILLRYKELNIAVRDRAPGPFL